MKKNCLAIHSIKIYLRATWTGLHFPGNGITHCTLGHVGGTLVQHHAFFFFLGYILIKSPVKRLEKSV